MFWRSVLQGFERFGRGGCGVKPGGVRLGELGAKPVLGVCGRACASGSAEAEAEQGLHGGDIHELVLARKKVSLCDEE